MQNFIISETFLKSETDSNHTLQLVLFNNTMYIWISNDYEDSGLTYLTEDSDYILWLIENHKNIPNLTKEQWWDDTGINVRFNAFFIKLDKLAEQMYRPIFKDKVIESI